MDFFNKGNSINYHISDYIDVTNYSGIYMYLNRNSGLSFSPVTCFDENKNPVYYYFVKAQNQSRLSLVFEQYYTIIDTEENYTCYLKFPSNTKYITLCFRKNNGMKFMLVNNYMDKLKNNNYNLTNFAEIPLLFINNTYYNNEGKIQSQTDRCTTDKIKVYPGQAILFFAEYWRNDISGLVCYNDNNEIESIVCGITDYIIYDNYFVKYIIPDNVASISLSGFKETVHESALVPRLFFTIADYDKLYNAGTNNQELIKIMINSYDNIIEPCYIDIKSSTKITDHEYLMQYGGYAFIYYKLSDLNNLQDAILYIEQQSPAENFYIQLTLQTQEQHENLITSNIIALDPIETDGDIKKYIYVINTEDLINASIAYICIRGDGRGYSSNPIVEGQTTKIKFKIIQDGLGKYNTTSSASLQNNSLILYCSPDGLDSNDGSIENPKKTIANAISAGATKILLFSGIYTEYNISINRSIDISKKDSDGIVLFKPTSDRISTTETKLSGYNKIYTIDTTRSIQFNFIFQDNIPDENTLITDIDRLPLQRGYTYRCQDTKIYKCNAENLEDALTEIDTDDKYKYYYDNNILYFSRPAEVSDNNPIWAPSSNKLFSFDTTNNNYTLKLSGINTKYCSINITGTVNSEIVDCQSINCQSAGAFVYDKSTNIKFIRCEAACAQTANGTGDGFNGHSTNTGEIYSKQTTCTLIDCWAHDNNDDGYSDHERSETTIIGGLYENNGKAGITPANGSHCSCYNVYSRYNYCGFYYTNGANSAEGGKYGQLLCNSCYAESNGYDGGLGYGFYVDSIKNKLDCINCVSINNKTAGYGCGANSNNVKLINCKSYNETKTNFGLNSNITIINPDIL